jgi:hypothetical protein
MQLIDFYKAVLPPTGPYALFNPEPRPGRHIWADTLDELVTKTIERSKTIDWYFATGSFLNKRRLQANVIGKKCFYLDIDAGEEKFQKNPKTAYRTIQEAVEALIEFNKLLALVPSIIVLSGGGMHVYYSLSEVLSGAQWEVLANKLKKAVKASGFKADPTSTSDSARVLRPPGTTHWSGTEVRVLRATSDAYTPGQMLEAIERIPIPDAPQTPDLSDLDATFAPVVPQKYANFYDNNDDIRQFEPVPTSALKIVKECGALQEVAITGGDVTEPQWRAMIGIVKHCVEGENLVHEWSKGHAQYDHFETREKFQRYAAGPSLCETFSAYSSKCGVCPHNGKIKSPIVLGRITIEDEAKPDMAAAVEAAKAQSDSAPAPPPVAGIPEGVLGAYRCHNSGSINTLLGKAVKLKKLEGGETIKVEVWVPFTQDVFWLTGWTEAGRHDNENSTLALVLFRRGRYQAFELPNETTADRKALLKFLNSKTINPLNYEGDTLAMMQQYVNDQIRLVKEAAAKPVVRDHLGFHMDAAGELYCAHGEYIIYKDGTIRKATLGHSLETVRYAMMIDALPPVNTGKWGKECWAAVSEAANKQVAFYREWWGKPGLEVAQLAIMLQMASPLLVFAATTDMVPQAPLPAIGLTVSLFSTESAKGKTSIQTAATYAFGDPASLIRQGDRLGMTFNAQIATAAALGTFPFPMDEVTTNDAQQVGESINRIASGIEKLRAGKDGHLARSPVSWALVSTVSTNVPQRELVGEFQKGSDALQMRLIELDCDVLPTRASGVVPEYDAALRQAMSGSKGCLGAILHLYCVVQGYERMRKKALDKFRYVTDISPGESKERFILRGIAAMLLLADILGELNLAFFDPRVLEIEAIKALTGAREYSLNTNKEPAFQFLNMLRDLSPNVLITTADLAADTAQIENDRTVRPPYAGRLCRDSNVLYLSADAARKWATEKGISPSAVMAEAKVAGYLLGFNGDNGAVSAVNLGKGLRGYWTPRTSCWKIAAGKLRAITETHGGTVVPLRRAEDKLVDTGGTNSEGVGQ